MRCAAVFLLIAMICGCVQTPYRYEVHDMGEGSVQVVTVPKTPEASPTAAAPVTPASTSSVPLPVAPAVVVTPATATDAQRIDALEARVKALSIENEKLKQSATTAPVKD